MATGPRPKFIGSLTFRGFEMSPNEVEALVGAPATASGTRGTPRKPGTTALQRSFVSWAIEFPDATRLDEMIPALLSSAGGKDALLRARNAVNAEFLEVELSLWVKDSECQEGGCIEASSIAMLAEIGATLSLGFYRRDGA